MGGITIAAAANTGCTDDGTTANCNNVPADGISYLNDVSTVNVTNGGASTTVDANTIGIDLRKTGVDGATANNYEAPTNYGNFTTTVTVNSTSWTVLANSAGGTAITINGYYVRVFDNGTPDNKNDDTYALGNATTPSFQTFANATLLADYLQNAAVAAGGPVSGSLTVNNPGASGTGGSFSTTNAHGINVESIGGRGGNGGCTTILIATWCDAGDNGGSAGSVAVNNGGTIVVTGDGKYGISAVSQGGAGGNGGGSFGLIYSGAERGGNGGNGAAVTVSLGATSNITTTGTGSHGVYATSSGGNGGKGGSSGGLVALGSNGGDGGDAGIVEVDNFGRITTNGNNSHGIFAQSIGAGAGAGSGTGGLVAVGGNGGGQSDGKDVTVVNGASGVIVTRGFDSFGILAQSIGGGGGDGGSSGGLFTVGGNAGSGGGSGTVRVTNAGSVTTAKAGSVAVFAQSVGGGGGNGGNAYSGSVSVSVAVGGDGGLGGNGGQVFVNDTANVDTLVSSTIVTGGDRAHGIQAQSVGGGGGNGGLAVAATFDPLFSASVAIGGKANGGGSGNTVTVNERGTITTGGNQAHGIFAQSVGGSGGSGGGSVAASASGGYSLGVSLGGTGGSGGSANQVVVNARGSIDTTGNLSHGILAQSVGGGGGNGGFSVAVTGGAMSGAVSLGGDGATAGNGSTVTVNTAGIDATNMTIHTRGDGSHGIFAQSVGGGGGSGGFAAAVALGGGAVSVGLGGSGAGGGLGDTVNVTNRNTILTDGANSYGILAQSVGGGGGNGGFTFAGSAGVMAVAVSVGGRGGAGGNGGAVTVDNFGDITTKGDLSYGVLAQSVGGGGGNGGSAIAATVAISIKKLPAVAASVAIGGAGGTASVGGHVSINNDGSVTTGTLNLSTGARTGHGAHALFAQSVGGGGGSGGFAGAVALAIDPTGSGAAAFAVAVGGRGGTGGNAGIVDVIHTGDLLLTRGDGADGIHAQSVGGGGGDGGFGLAIATAVGAAPESNGLALSVAIGGSGGAAGNGEAVTVNSSGAITTIGKFSNGIYAQSTGGGGGSGGFAAAFSGSFATAPDSNAAAVGVSVGGTGAAGGNGRKVTVTSSGAITTAGESSNGIFAQSIGGGGGNGGFAASGTIAIATKPDSNAFQAAVAVGGSGGAGGTGAMVEVDNSGAIITYGKESLGILAQSIGGGGGNGGMSVVGQIDKGTGNTGKIGVSVGGGGGSGNFAGIVDVDNLLGGSINTYGFGSHAIKAQSIGGGGGNGGMAIYGGLGFSGEETSVTVGVAVGGGGGDGGYGNTVDVTNNGAIDVQGDTATGIFAQSVGGGGGDGGGSFTGMLGVSNSDPANKDAMTVQVAVAIGGGGGDGNLGGAVIVNNTGSIETGSATLVNGEIVRTGGGGYGIFAQSVGGGGGIGGRANAMNLLIGTKCSIPLVCQGTASSGNNISLTATVGGNGGTASHGGNVTIDNTGAITTWGNDADGIYAQSVGGSGGNGGNGILGTGDVSPVPVELLFLPVGASKIYKTISVAVGGNTGTSGNGGIVDVDNSKNITTYGANSNGVFAQSVGGGGGIGGRGVIGATGTIGVGGKGGAAGDGGAVYVSNLGTAKIETFGVAANGIFAQSVGGGGGAAGNVNRMLAGGVDVPLVGHLGVNLGIGLGLGQSAGGGGDGGIVEVDVAGQIITHGDSAAGIFAHSVGGGGGVLGELGNDLPVLNLLSWHIGSNGGAGKAGAVTVDLDGTITTAGNSATGIFAQSSGGTGVGSKVTVSVTGSVQTAQVLTTQDISGGLQTRGLGSVGIMAQSAGWGGNGDVEISLGDITHTAGIVSGGRSAVVALDDPATLLVSEYAEYVGVGVWVIDGKDNTVTNYGTITTAGGVESGMAIYASGSDPIGGPDPDNPDPAKMQLGGNEAVSNFGTVTGSVDLGVGTNSFVNETAGTFNSGRFARFGDGNLLTNYGVMAAGGKNKVMTTAINGDMTQALGGIYAVDLDLEQTGLAGEADLIDIDGTLTVDGAVDLTLLNMGNALPGEHEVVIARSDTALLDNGITLNTAPSLVVTYGLETRENLLPGIDTELVLSYAIDFEIEGLNPNQGAMGAYVNAFQLAGGSEGLEPLVASLIQIPDLETYQETLDQLSPEPYLINQTLAMLAGLQFENSLMSCKVQDGFDAEGQCAWATVNHRKTERGETDTNLGFEQNSFGLSAGAQARINENFVAGIGGSWEDLGTESNGNTSSSGNRFQGGAVFKGVWGNTVLAGAVTGGWSSQDVSRFVDLPMGGPSYVLEGTQEIGFASGHVRLSHSFASEDWYVRPMVDVGVTQVSIGDFAETGGPVALEIEGHDETYVTIAPSIELGGEMDLGDDAILRSFLRVGALGVVLGTNPEISAGFADAPDGVAPFTIVGDIDEVIYDVTLGFDVISTNGVTFRLTGDTKVGDTIKSYGGSMKLSAPF